MKKWLNGWVVVVFFLLAYLFPLGGRPMFRPDEYRYAEIPREMIATGNWVAPKLAGIRYFEKPALGYQFIAACFRVFGENAFALRLPSALAAGIVALFLFFLLRKTEPDETPELPAFGALCWLGCGIVWGVGTFAVLDMPLTAALTLAIGGFFMAYRAQGKGATCAWLLAAGLAAGVAFLLKGFLAFAVPVIVIVPFLVWQKQWRKLFLYPWLPLIGAVAVALPWSLEIARMEPDFWRYFFIEEHLNRFLGETYDRSAEPFWYFIPVLLGGVMPVGLLALAAWRGWTKAFFRTPFHRFLLCWAVLPFLFFSISSCKLGTYILPCFPPIAMLIALGLAAARCNAPGCERKIWNIVGVVLGVLLLLAVLGGVVFLGIRHELGWVQMGALTGLAAWGLLLAAMRRHETIFVWVLAGGMALPLLPGLFSIPPALAGKAATENGLHACLTEQPILPDDSIYVERSVVQPVAWMLKRTDMVLVGKMGELEYGLKRYPAEYADRHVEDEAWGKHLTERHGKRAFYIRLEPRRKKPLPADVIPLKTVRHYGVELIEVRPRAAASAASAR